MAYPAEVQTFESSPVVGAPVYRRSPYGDKSGWMPAHGEPMPDDLNEALLDLSPVAPGDGDRGA